MVKIIVGVEGMACGMCEAHINEAVRNAFPVKKVTSSHTKKQTVIIAESSVDEEKLKDVIANPVRTLCNKIFSVFFINSTHAAPKAVPRNGIKMP